MVFPNDSLGENNFFDLLRKGYVEARYDKKYAITKDEVQVLINRAEKLQHVTEITCKKKIEEFNF